MDAFRNAFESQKENAPRKGSDSAQTRPRAYCYNSPQARANLAQDRKKQLTISGLVEVQRDDGQYLTCAFQDVVKFPAGTLQQKIEYAMDKLGPAVVTRYLMDSNIDWRQSKGLANYRKVLDELVALAIEAK